MCSNRDRRERSTRAENRQPSAALAEITRRRAAHQAKQQAGQSVFTVAESGRVPHAIAAADSGATSDSGYSPAYVDLTASTPQEDTGRHLSARTQESSGSAALSVGRIHLAPSSPEDELGDGAVNIARASSAQPQQQPRKLNRLRRARSPDDSGSSASSSHGAAGRQLANAAGGGLGGLLASFGALQVSRTAMSQGHSPQLRDSLAAAAAMPLPGDAGSCLAAAAELPLPAVGNGSGTGSGGRVIGHIDLVSSTTADRRGNQTPEPPQHSGSSGNSGRMTSRREAARSGSIERSPDVVVCRSSSSSDDDSGSDASGAEATPEPARDEESSASEAGTDEPFRLGEAGELQLDPQVAANLYNYQIEGVTWLHRLHTLRRGGILADDMGLGKTMQCAAFLGGMVRSRLIRRAIVLAPKTLLGQWAAELRRCGLAGRVFEYHGTSASDRDVALQSAFLKRGVLLTSYGMVLHNAEALASPPAWLRGEQGADADTGVWDFMFLDEGHKIKNAKTKLVQALRTVPVGVRVILSGTPIQNNLGEMHALFDFACEGLLGDARHFKNHFSRPIEAGNDRHATERMRQVAAGRAAELRSTIAPFFLRREKGSVQQIRVGDKAASSGASGGEPAPQPMPHKNDLIVWLRMQPQQRRIYEAFLGSKDVKKALNQSQSALAALTVLKKVCDHPALLSERAASTIAQKGSDKSGRRHRQDTSAGGFVDSEASDADASDADAGPALDESLMHEMHDTGIEPSCKTRFVMQLLPNLIATGHRTLVFSQSRVMLDILQAAIKDAGWRFLRLDGSVTSAADRAAIVARFQRDAGIPICLLTSQVGGLGLTLTAADRVILVDPSWNPAADNQAVDRAYRIGQTRDVVVYRLITCGSVEEKIYRRQVFKGGLSRAGTRDEEQLRYFSYVELRDLFSLKPEEVGASKTQADLAARHGSQRRTTPQLDAHLATLPSLPNYVGFSDHDLLFTRPGEQGGSCAAAPSAGSATAQSAAGASFQSRQQARPPAAVAPARRRATGWGGAGQLSSLLEKSLTLQPGGSAPPCSSQPAGKAAVGVSPHGGSAASGGVPAFGSAPASDSTSARQPAARGANSQSPDSLQERLARARSLLGNAGLVAKLPDGGARLRGQVAELQRQLNGSAAD